MRFNIKGHIKQLKDIIDFQQIKEIKWRKEIPYIILLIFMAFYYISNQYEAERLAVEKNKLTKEIHELREKSIAFASELMFISKPSEVSRSVTEKGLGLKDANKPPIKIVIDSKNGY